MVFTDIQKIGIGLSGFGVFFLTIGIIFLFDKGLLAIGNLLFLTGLCFIIGVERTLKFFFQKQKIKGSSFFFGGIFVVIIGWPFIGMILEVYGFIVLFGGFIPVAVSFLRRIPILGTFLALPGIKQLMDKLGESNSMV